MTSLLNIAGNIPVSAAAEQGQSLRFEDGDSAYLTRTPTTAGNQQTWTWSGWVKRGNLGNNYFTLFSAKDASLGNYLWIQYTSSNDDQLQIYQYPASDSFQLTTTGVFRDPSAWYHVVVVSDTTNATSGDRIKLYINGERVTNFSTENYPAQNYNTAVNRTNKHSVGSYDNNSYFYDGYLANVCFIDGQALDPTSFGEYSDTLWRPKSDADIQSLTFGTNGFYLPFKQTTEAEGFSTVTYTGSGSSQAIKGVGFEPDVIWVKARNTSSYGHKLYDSVRGFSQELSVDATDGEYTLSGRVSANSDGFDLGTYAGVNGSGNNYVAWCWDAGSGSAVSNTDGSITSSVKANTAKGFSVVSYTGNSTSGATVGHGLGVEPELIIVKNRDVATNWAVWNTSLSSGQVLTLNTTNGASTPATAYWDDANNTSSVFALGTNNETNDTDNYVGYCFHSVSGYSSIGSYSGTGASGNSITGLGFKPAWIMIKRTDNTGNWVIHDNTRSPVNPINEGLYPNTSDAENTGWNIDFDADGFTLNTTGTWQNASGGTYIYMAFADTRDATFFGDTSGNGNNWTPNALNNTDVVPDSPVTGGNFAVMNPLDDTGVNTSEGNLKVTPSSDFKIIQGTIACNKNYFEGRFVSGGGGNIQDMQFGVYASNGNFTRIGGDGKIYKDGSLVSSNTAYGVGDIVGIAVDVPSGTIQFYRNGTANGSAATVNTTDEYLPHFRGANARVGHFNFGQDSSFAGNATPQGNTDDNGVGDFYYAPPSGFLALTTGNLPTPAITAPDEYFNTVLYTGNGTTQSITGVGFQPDWTWIKRRDAANNHGIFDAVRGATNRLSSNTVSAEDTVSGVTSFDSDGFSLGADYNESSAAEVAWNWLAGNGTVSNTDGSITSTVSANQTAGFSIVSYTGTGASATVGHGLSQAPEMVIVKNRIDATNWLVFTTVIDGTHDYLSLDLTSAKGNESTNIPTSSVFSVGAGGAQNGSSDDMIAYCFHSVESYSKCGVYTGNGASSGTAGTYVHLGFRPAWVMLKRTDSTGNWWMLDSNRDPFNEALRGLKANGSDAETAYSGNFLDFYSNGFAPRTSGAEVNASGGTYIFLAFAEAPFKSANAR